MTYKGHRDVDSTVYFTFTTNDGSGGRVEPNSAFEAADVRIYKDGSATQRSSESGYTMTSPFDSMVGVQHLSIDLSDNTDDGFYAAGSHYEVILYPDETIDSQNVSKVIGSFDIGPANVNVQQVSGDSGAADNLEADYDGTGYNKSNSAIGTTTTNTDMRGTDSAATATALATAQADLDVLTGTDGATLATAQANYAPATPAQVNAEVLDVLNVDTFAEPGQGTPGATISIFAKINYLYKGWRNKKKQTSSEWDLFADDGTTVDQKAALSDDGTTTEKGEIATGP